MTKIKEIAKRAGVAISTVSNALTGKKFVSDELKEKVFATCKELNYKPNYIAKLMTQKSTGLIGFYFDTTHETFSSLYPPLIKGLCTTVASYDNTLVLYWDIHKKATRHFATKGLIDGAIILGPFDDDYRIKEFLKDEIPFVIIGKVPVQFDKSLPHIDNDNEGVIYGITQKLIKSGHEKICFISGQKALTICQDRYRGFKQAHCDCGLKFNENSVINLSIIGGKEATEALIARGQEGFTAFITESDQTAAGVYEYAKQVGKKIGEDFAVASLGGFVDLNFTPPLTTVRVDVEQLGIKSAEMLFDILKNGEYVNNEFMESNIIYAASSEFKL